MGQLKLGLLLCVALLSACQHKPGLNPDSSQSWHTPGDGIHQSMDRPSSSKWRYSAKVGITTDKLREQANLVWQFSDQANTVRLFGPLGAGAIKIDFDEYGVRLSDNKGELYSGASAEQLLRRITGWSIPVDRLSYWLFAKPSPDTVYRYQLDEQGSIAAIEQAGWVIQYSDYRDYGGQARLPRKLIATQLGQTGVSVKLITKAWQF